MAGRATTGERLSAVEQHLAKISDHLGSLTGAAPMPSAVSQPVQIVDHTGKPYTGAGAQPVVVQVPNQAQTKGTDWGPVLEKVAAAVMPVIAERLLAPPPDPIAQFTAMADVIQGLKEDKEDAFGVGDMVQLAGMAKEMGLVNGGNNQTSGELNLAAVASAVGISEDQLRAFVASKAAHNGQAG